VDGLGVLGTSLLPVFFCTGSGVDIVINVGSINCMVDDAILSSCKNERIFVCLVINVDINNIHINKIYIIHSVMNSSARVYMGTRHK
jgi:hypothetical protein